jgi:PTS system galactitol-specific IIB component
MAKTKRILVACGTAVATSTVVAKAIEEACKQAGISVTTQQCKASEIMMLLEQGADLVVTTTPVPNDIQVPVIQGLPFLTGIGREQTLKQIIDTLKS